MKRATIKVEVPNSEVTLRFDYERVMFVDVCRCPAGLFDEIRFKLARTMADRDRKNFVAFTDPSLMTYGECERMMEFILSSYKAKFDVLVVATHEIYLEWMRCMQYMHGLKVSYATIDVRHGQNMQTVIDVIRPKPVRGKKLTFETFDGKSVHDLAKPFMNRALELVRTAGRCRMNFYKKSLSEVAKAVKKVGAKRSAK